MNPPSAPRKVLVLLAGFVWSIVGLALTGVAGAWLAAAHQDVVLFVIAAVVGGVIVHRFGFSKLAATNLRRVYEQAPSKEKVCVFAFQNARSYALIVVMMVFGYALRHLPIPKFYLAPIYGAIGLGLLLSSLKYYRHLAYSGKDLVS